MDIRRILMFVSFAMFGIALILMGLRYAGYPVPTYLPLLFLFIPLVIPSRAIGRGEAKVTDNGCTYCPECGYQLDPGDSFCKVCGRML